MTGAQGSCGLWDTGCGAASGSAGLASQTSGTGPEAGPGPGVGFTSLVGVGSRGPPLGPPWGRMLLPGASSGVSGWSHDPLIAQWEVFVE